MVAIEASCVENGIESVPDFYAGKCVFITGGTGFLGKVMVEKILYSCPDVEKIFILVREKKKKEVQERMEILFNCPVFNRLKEKRPQDLLKVIPIVGDIVAPNLGIKAEDEELLINKVSVVIHSAATLRFDEPLTVALAINVEGTRKVLDLCHRMKNIQALVHVSTAYCNAMSDVVEERIYPPPMELDEAYELAKNLGREVTMESLSGRPNTYAFTKALSENLINDLHGDIPTAIVRPSIVTPSISEPLKGWVDNWYGATSVLLAVGKGYCKLIVGNRNNLLDIIPVDYVSNAIIVAASKLRRSDGVRVLNSCSSSTNPITMGKLSEYFTEECVKNHFNVVPYPFVFVLKYAWIVWFLSIFLEYIPACLVDFWQHLRGKPTSYVKMQSQLSVVRKVLTYFTSHSWVMQTGDMRALAASLAPADARLFPCDPRDICWRECSATYYSGVKRFLVDKDKK